MLRRWMRWATFAGMAAGAVAAIRAMTRSRDPLPQPAVTRTEPWPPLRPEPVTATATTAATAAAAAAWVEPLADGSCPPTHPIKAKLSSRIFHSPGQMNYDRTTPDRCYVDAAAAEADGMRAAKR